MTGDEIRGVLRSTTLFAGFNDEQLDAVRMVARERRFEPGEQVVHEGDAGARSFWLVLEGRVDVRSGGEALGSVGPGETFGEMALLSDEPRAADVVAAAPTTALELARSHLRGVIHSDPDAGLGIAAQLSVRLRRLTEQMATLLRSSPEAAEAARRLGVVGTSDRGGSTGGTGAGSAAGER